MAAIVILENYLRHSRSVRPESENPNGRVLRQNSLGGELSCSVHFSPGIDANWRCRVCANGLHFDPPWDARAGHEDEFFARAFFSLSIHRFSQWVSGDDSDPDEAHDGNAESQLQRFHAFSISPTMEVARPLSFPRSVRLSS